MTKVLVEGESQRPTDNKELKDMEVLYELFDDKKRC